MAVVGNNLNDSIWTRVTNAWTSIDGSSGVIFASSRNCIDTALGESASDMVYVIKGSSHIAQETFAHALAVYVSGLKLPSVRLVQYTSPEWAAIKKALYDITGCIHAADVWTDEVSNSYLVNHKLTHQLNRPFFHVMEYVPGAPLLCNYNTGKYFGFRTISSHVDAEHEVEASFALSLGRLIAFDLLINNSDRFPTSVHDNDGNASNIILTPFEDGGCEVVAIDTCVSTINPEQQSGMMTLYVHRVAQFLCEMHHHSTAPSIVKSLQQFKSFIQNETCYEMTEYDLLQVAAGVRRGVQEVLRGLTKEIIVAEYLSLRQVVPTDSDWENVWEQSVNLISTDFLCQVYDCFAVYRDWKEEEVNCALQSSKILPAGTPTQPIIKTEVENLSSSSLVSDIGVSVVAALDSASTTPIAAAGVTTPDTTINLLLLQMHATRSGKLLGDEIAKQLQKTISDGGRAVDFVVLPEGCLGSCVGPLPSGIGVDNDLEECGELAYLARVAKQFACYVVCGSVWEIPKEQQVVTGLAEGRSDGDENESGKCYITCVVIGPDGKMTCKYRKRQVAGACISPGIDVGVFDTRFGKMAVLICGDMENRTFVADTLAEKPVMIFNPTHLVLPSTTAVMNSPELMYSGWKLALDASARYIEYLCTEHNLSVVRVDQAGSGNSFVATPACTHYALSKYQENMFCSVMVRDGAVADSSDEGRLMSAQLRLVGDLEVCCPTRTATFDNSGVRFLYRSLQNTRTPPPSPLNTGTVSSMRRHVHAVASFPYLGRPRGYLVVLREVMVEVWDVAAVVVIYKYTLTDENTVFTASSGRSPWCAADGSVFIVHSRNIVDEHTIPSRCYTFTRSPVAAAGGSAAAYTVDITDVMVEEIGTAAAVSITNSSLIGGIFSSRAQVSTEISRKRSQFSVFNCQRPGGGDDCDGVDTGPISNDSSDLVERSWCIEVSDAPTTVTPAISITVQETVVGLHLTAVGAQVSSLTEDMAPIRADSGWRHSRQIYYSLPLPINCNSADFVHYNSELHGLLCIVSGHHVYIVQLFCNKALKRLDTVLN